MAKKQLNVDLDDLVEAMEQGDNMLGIEMIHYLDTDTGEIKMIGGDLSFDIHDLGDEFPEDAKDWEREAWEDAKAVADDTRGRFVEVDRRESHDAWQVMADFVAEVPDPRMRERLERAIAGKGAFRRFKDELFSDPDVREKWFAFEQETKREWARDWLEDLDIESTWSPPVVKQKQADWQPKIVCIHHVQITIPPGQEHSAREFYCKKMGLKEIEKPEALKSRGGFWLGIGDLQLHIGAETGGDRKATKAHLAYQVTDIAKWRDRLEKIGVQILESVAIPGFERFEFRDPFGNRVELIQPVA